MVRYDNLENDSENKKIIWEKSLKSGNYFWREW